IAWPAVPISASVPEYLTTSSASPQLGAVPSVANVPQSLTTRLSLAESGFVTSVSTGVLLVSVKAPPRLPVFLMSTVPAAVPPGRRLDAVRTARLSALLDIDSVPVEKVLAGLADCAVKSAPDATVRPVAARTVARAPRVRRGRLTSRARRD